MSAIDGTFLDFKGLDRLAAGDRAIHRLDPRAKVLATVVFIVAVVSFNRYELAALLPLFVFPAVMIALGNLPALYIVKKVALVIPFAVMIGMLNPWFDRDVIIQVGTWGVTGGWVSFASIIVRAVLTTAAALILVAVTGFPAICMALERLGMPQAFAVQLLVLYRYIFVLGEETSRAVRARELRTFGNKGRGRASSASLLGHLLLRTWLRAEKIHMAMLARGFTGAFYIRRHCRFGGPEVAFLLGWSALFVILRLANLPRLLGSLVLGLIP